MSEAEITSCQFCGHVAHAPRPCNQALLRIKVTELRSEVAALEAERDKAMVEVGILRDSLEEKRTHIQALGGDVTESGLWDSLVRQRDEALAEVARLREALENAPRAVRARLASPERRWTVSSPTLCPTCGRRPSEAMSVRGYGGSVVRSDRCPDPIHDRADACGEMAALLRGATEHLRTLTGWVGSGGLVPFGTMGAATDDVRKANAFLLSGALARLEGGKRGNPAPARAATEYNQAADGEAETPAAGLADNPVRED